jgi:hypothetical protein
VTSETDFGTFPGVIVERASDTIACGARTVRFRFSCASGLRSFLGAVSNLLLAIGAAIITLMALHVIADVSCRYLLNQPLPGTIEIVSLYYMVAVIYLPLAYVQS